MPKIITIGELLIDFISLDADCGLAESSGFKKAAGGAPANLACGIARLGEDVGFIGKVGEDQFGHFLSSVVKNENVDISHLLFDKESMTTLSFVARKSDGARDCIFYRKNGADVMLNPEELNESYFNNCEIFAFGSNSLTANPSRDATIKGIEIAKGKNALIAYDPNLRLSLWADETKAREEIINCFKYADIVKISDEEMEFITGFNSFEQTAEYVHSFGCKLVLISCGKDGCYISNKDKLIYIEPKKVTAIDSTGAGDAFFASFIYHLTKLLQTTTLDEIIKDDTKLTMLGTISNVAGALATTKIGAINGLPRLEDLR